MLFGAEQRGELPDDLGLFGVAAERDARHLQVVPDQKVDRLPRLVVEAEPRDHAGRHLRADDRVIALAGLADVVIQQRQHQQLRRAELAQHRAESRDC